MPPTQDRPADYLLAGTFGERAHMVRRLFGEKLLLEELEDRRDQNRNPVPFLDMAGRWDTPHHQSTLGIPQVIHTIRAWGNCTIPLTTIDL